MKHISILIPKGASSLSNIEGTLQIFSEANNLAEHMGKGPLFKIELVGLEKENVQRGGLFSIQPNSLISDVNKTDLIIIPALFGDLQQSIGNNEAFIPWILDQYRDGAEVASFCIGAFFLARTGLLDGKPCTTHWRYVNEFRQMYPQADIVDDKIMTEVDGIYTSGGAYSYLNLVIYLIEKYAGRDVAIAIAKAFMIDIDRISQSPFIIFSGQKSHADEPVKQAQEFIEKHYHEKITVDQLASMFAVGRRSLERRFKSATANTVMEYLQRVKVEAAKKGLETGRKSVNEVMYDVGYVDVKAFRSVFKKVTGLSPVEYRNKYNREATALQ
ncbi:MAG TPA: helix-turn-helix domain-containing protein [Chitinophagaceae bacterium]|nr:helix-turn-helix domain-containing protein [Chitinophagaceae bacterium]